MGNVDILRLGFGWASDGSFALIFFCKQLDGLVIRLLLSEDRYPVVWRPPCLMILHAALDSWIASTECDDLLLLILL